MCSKVLLHKTQKRKSHRIVFLFPNRRNWTCPTSFFVSCGNKQKTKDFLFFSFCFSAYNKANSYKGGITKMLTCERCKALRFSGSEPSCLLGHPIDPATTAPLESCERPLLYLDLQEYLNDLKRRITHETDSRTT